MLGIFNVRTDVNACDCVAHGGCTDTVKESALTDDWEKNPLPHRGIEPVSAACRSDAIPAELHPNPFNVAEVLELPSSLLRFVFFSISNSFPTFPIYKDVTTQESFYHKTREHAHFFLKIEQLEHNP